MSNRTTGHNPPRRGLGSSPDYRWNAVAGGDRVRVVRAVAGWEGAGAATQVPTVRLSLSVEIREALRHTRAWLDVYSFDADGGLVGFGTHDLRYAEPAGDGVDLFAFDGPVWGAGLGLPGPAAPRTLKYRVYVRPEAGLFTDGILHNLPLPLLRAGRARRPVPRMAPRAAG